MSRVRKCNKDILEEVMEQIFIFFFVLGVFVLLAVIPIAVLFGATAATICIAVWVCVWGLSFVLFLAWPGIRWVASKISELIL